MSSLIWLRKSTDKTAEKHSSGIDVFFGVVPLEILYLVRSRLPSLSLQRSDLDVFHVLIQTEGSKTARAHATASPTTPLMGSVSFQSDTALKRKCLPFKVHVDIIAVVFMSL
jgi:hypothetical protein